MIRRLRSVSMTPPDQAKMPQQLAGPNWQIGPSCWFGISYHPSWSGMAARAEPVLRDATHATRRVDARQVYVEGCFMVGAMPRGARNLTPRSRLSARPFTDQ